MKLADYIALFFLGFLALSITILNSEIKEWHLLLLLNAAFIHLTYYVITRYESKANRFGKDSLNNTSILKIWRYFYGIPFILISFKEVYHIIFALKWKDIDPILINIDKAVFGLNPTEWISRFANPALTELLQIVYFLYYIVILAWGIELYMGKRFKEYKFTIFVLFSLFTVNYTLYILLPAAGPRFYIHDYFSIQNELPGLLFTESIRTFLNMAESIPDGISNPLLYVQRDAMPSLHVGAALLIVYLSRKFKSKSFYIYIPYSLLMIISTVYLRYHYVIDVISGVLVVCIIILSCELIYKKFHQIIN